MSYSNYNRGGLLDLTDFSLLKNSFIIDQKSTPFKKKKKRREFYKSIFLPKKKIILLDLTEFSLLKNSFIIDQKSPPLKKKKKKEFYK